MKCKLTKTGAFWLSCLFSILLFLTTCWFTAFHDNTAYWVESIGFFMLSYICIDEFSKRIPDINPWMIGLAIILGHLILPSSIHIYDFSKTLGSLMITISGFIAIILGVFCYKDKRPYTFILSYVVLTLFNSCVADMWKNYVMGIIR